MVVFSSHGAVLLQKLGLLGGGRLGRVSEPSALNGFACSAFSLASRATSIIRCTSLTSRGGSVFHHFGEVGELTPGLVQFVHRFRLGRRGSRPTSRRTGSGLDPSSCRTCSWGGAWALRPVAGHATLWAGDRTQ